MRFYDDPDDDDDHYTEVRVPVQQHTRDETPRRTSGSAAQLHLLRLLETQGGQAESPGGMVQVTVDAAGRIQDIRLDPRLSATPLDQLSDHIAATCAAAFNHRLDAIAQLARDHADALDPDMATQIAVMTAHLKDTT